MKSIIKKSLVLAGLFVLITQYSFCQKKNKTKIKRHHSISINHHGNDTDLSEGFWNLNEDSEGTLLELSSKKGATYAFKRDSFFISFYPFFEELDIIKNASSNFSIIRAAGTINCSENGTFTFEVNKDFKTFLSKEGIKDGKPYDFVKLFLGDVDRDYVLGVKNEGYQPTFKQLGKMGLLGVDIAYIKSISQTQYKGLDLDMLTKFHIHGVEKSYIDELAALGYSNLDANMLKKFAIHSISVNYIKGLNDAGYTNLDANMIKKFAIHSVSVDYIKGLNDLGYKNLEPNVIKNFAVHSISLNYVKSLLNLEINKPTMSAIKKAKIHDVSVNFIKRANKAGHDSKNLSDYVKLKIRGL